jgi:hypothetical protein
MRRATEWMGRGRGREEIGEASEKMQRAIEGMIGLTKRIQKSGQ